MGIFSKIKNFFKTPEHWNIDFRRIRQRHLEKIASQLENIANKLETDIERAIHNTELKNITQLEYILEDGAGYELQMHPDDPDFLSIDDIKNSAGYENFIQTIQVKQLEAEMIAELCEEYDDEDRERYLVRISGWT